MTCVLIAAVTLSFLGYVPNSQIGQPAPLYAYSLAVTNETALPLWQVELAIPDASANAPLLEGWELDSAGTYYGMTDVAYWSTDGAADLRPGQNLDLQFLTSWHGDSLPVELHYFDQATVMDVVNSYSVASAIPEPATLGLFIPALWGLLMRRGYSPRARQHERTVPYLETLLAERDREIAELRAQLDELKWRLARHPEIETRGDER
jgi:hypothetical protein